jgi:glycosyltransferase involved in cell wall biosynthesis
MITVVYSTHKDEAYNDSFNKHIHETIGLKNFELLYYQNNNEFSLSEIYNRGLKESKNDIVIFLHNDIIFEKKYWGKKIIEHFNKNKDYGIIGVAGTRYLSNSGKWWDIQGEMVGQVYHQHNGKKWLSEYNKPFGNGIIDSVLVDGLFICVNKKIIKTNFNETYKGFHFYDVSFCISNFIMGVKIGTISNVPITHLSIGITNNKWEENRKQFVIDYIDKFPFITNSTYPNFEINKKIPLVSFIITIYNYGVMFEKTLQSIFNSTYKNLEIIVVNDGSTDKYVIEKLKNLNSKNIKVIHQNNNGPSSARNNGVKLSIGDYILPLDADDLIQPEYIQSCVNILNHDLNVSPVYCDTHHIGDINNVEQRPEWTFERLIQGPFIVNCSMFHRKAFDLCGGYDIELNGWEDYDLWIRMALNNYIGKRIPKPLFLYFHHEKDGTVSTNANKNQQELYIKIINKNFNKNGNNNNII